MKKGLVEEINRIHSITYGQDIVEQHKLVDKVRRFFSGSKARLISDDVKEYFDTLSNIKKPIHQRSRRDMEFQKNVEAVQIGLVLLGYELPRFGVDGLFGPETGAAVNKFKTDNPPQRPINEEMLRSPLPFLHITSQYGATRTNRSHPGVDLRAASGTEVRSPASGLVIDADFKSGGCGGTIQIKHSGGLTTRYCHMKDIRVRKNQRIEQGHVIGLSGGAVGDRGAGSSRGPHLHLELKKDGQLVDPMRYIDTATLTQQPTGGGAVITPEMVQTMIQKLGQRGVSKDDLKPLTVPEIVTDNLTPENFYHKLLESLGAPVTRENLKFLTAWRQAEGGRAKNNPFNTTYNMPGSTTLNSFGVRHYRTIEDGLTATVRTLRDKRYECILIGLIRNIGAVRISRCGSLKTWGTGDGVYRVLLGYESGATPKAPSIA